MKRIITAISLKLVMQVALFSLGYRWATSAFSLWQLILVSIVTLVAIQFGFKLYDELKIEILIEDIERTFK